MFLNGLLILIVIVLIYFLFAFAFLCFFAFFLFFFRFRFDICNDNEAWLIRIHTKFSLRDNYVILILHIYTKMGTDRHCRGMLTIRTQHV